MRSKPSSDLNDSKWSNEPSDSTKFKNARLEDALAKKHAIDIACIQTDRAIGASKPSKSGMEFEQLKWLHNNESHMKNNRSCIWQNKSRRCRWMRKKKEGQQNMVEAWINADRKTVVERERRTSSETKIRVGRETKSDNNKSRSWNNKCWNYKVLVRHEWNTRYQPGKGTSKARNGNHGPLVPGVTAKQIPAITGYRSGRQDVRGESTPKPKMRITQSGLPGRDNGPNSHQRP